MIYILLGKKKSLLNIKVLVPDFVEGLPKILDLGYFVLIWWQTEKKIRNPEAELQELVHFDRTAN